MITHLERSPVFVIGQARSGTTILTKLIRQHLEIAFGTESQFIVRVGRRAASFGDLEIRVNRRRLVESLATERFFARTKRNYGYAMDVNAVVAASGAGTYRSVLDAVFGQLATHMGFARWGDKTPEYALHLPELYALFPDAGYINVIRDGRDVALSTFEEHFGAKNVHVAAREWRDSLEAVARFRRAHPAARVLDVRYEDLLNQPADVFRSLIDFLHIAGGDELVSRVVAAVKAEIRADNSQKWRARLSPREHRLFEGVAGSLLDSHGYERVVPDARRPRRLEEMYWSADNLVRRVARQDYWSDTFYRLGLRLGTGNRLLRIFGSSKPSA